MLALTLCCLWLGPEEKRNPQFQREVGAELLCPLLGIREGTTAPAWAGSNAPLCLDPNPVCTCTGNQLERHMLGVSGSWHQIWEILLTAPSAWQGLASHPSLSGSQHIFNTICMWFFFPLGLYRQPPPLPQANNPN